MKHTAKIIGIGVALGLVLLVVKQGLNIPKDVFFRFYWIFGVVVIGGAVLCNALYIRHYQKKLKEAAALLEQGEAQEFICRIEELRRKGKGRYLQWLFTVNLSAGYCDLKEYQTAIDLLEPLANVRLRGDLKLVYCINLCVCYFYNGQTDKAMALYESSQKQFCAPWATALYGGNLAGLEILAEMEKGELAHAEKLLDAARKAWPNARLQVNFQYLEEKLQQKKQAAKA